MEGGTTATPSTITAPNGTRSEGGAGGNAAFRLMPALPLDRTRIHDIGLQLTELVVLRCRLGWSNP